MKKIIFALFLLTAAWSSLRSPVPEGKILSDMPLVRQSTSYTCGAAALLSVLEYYGIDDYNESELAAEMGTTPAQGTNIEKMAELAIRQGIKATVRNNLEIADLAAQVAKDQATIVDAQAWPDGRRGRGDEPYPDGWDSGHYMVVIGVDKKNIYFVDPSLVGSRGFIEIDYFLRRWHELSTTLEKVQRTAILFEGKPNPPRPWVPIP